MTLGVDDQATELGLEEHNEAFSREKKECACFLVSTGQTILCWFNLVSGSGLSSL